jgi:hypothetical protein
MIPRDELYASFDLLRGREGEHGWDVRRAERPSADEWWLAEVWRLESVREPAGRLLFLSFLVDGVPEDDYFWRWRDYVWAARATGERPQDDRPPTDGPYILALGPQWRDHLVTFLAGLHDDPLWDFSPSAAGRTWTAVAAFPGWSTCTDLPAMLAAVKGRASPRKLRLLACAFSRQAWGERRDRRGLRAVEAAERFADGQATYKELAAAAAQARGLPGMLASEAIPEVIGVAARHSDPAVLCDLVREVLGDPFRPVAVDPSWLRWEGGRVAAMAGIIYRGQRFAELPVLADALEDAGCSEEALLSHLRGGGRHVRGCWALDLVRSAG